jgi:hypothetical protein
MTVDGTYEISIQAPQGPQPMTIELKTSGSELSGCVREGDESLDLFEPTLSGNQVSFKIKVTKPMPLTLACEATVDGDSITGTASVSMIKLPFEGKRV